MIDITFSMLKIMEMEITEQNKVALYLFSIAIALQLFIFMVKCYL